MFDAMLGLKEDPRVKESREANPLYTLKVSPFLQPGNQMLTNIFLKETNEKSKIKFGLDRSNITLTAPNGREINLWNMHKLKINETGSEIGFETESQQTRQESPSIDKRSRHEREEDGRATAMTNLNDEKNASQLNTVEREEIQFKDI